MCVKRPFQAVLLTFLLAFSTAVAAKSVCQLEVSKGPCWKNYKVTVKLIDLTVNKGILSKVLQAETEKKSSINRIESQFNCYYGQKVQLRATIQPSIWEKDQGKEYSSTLVWEYTDNKAKGDVWRISACFHKNFSGVPLPPNQDLNCKCLDIKEKRLKQ